MSNFITYARRKMSTEEYEQVTMLDNYFGLHKYGVEFKNGEILTENEVEFKKI